MAASQLRNSPQKPLRASGRIENPCSAGQPSLCALATGPDRIRALIVSLRRKPAFVFHPGLSF
jgi:hypothetical protein